MGFTAKAQVYNAAIQETVLGVGDKALTLGGARTQPLCSFDETWKNAPAVGVEVSDIPFETEGFPVLAEYYAGCESFGDRVKRASEMEGAKFVCLHFEGADPGGENKSVEDIVALAKEAAAATDLPLVITGCKNVVSARKTGEYEVEVPAWGIKLQTARPVEDGLSAIGVRAHYFHPSTPHNRFPVCFAEEMEEPFETILQFRYAGQDPSSPPVWWRIPKDKRPASFPQELGVAPANVLLLYEV